MWQTILGLISPIFTPILNFFSNFINQYFSTQQTQIRAEEDVTTTAIKETSAVEQKWWFVSALIPAFALPYAIYAWKAIVWDKVMGPMFGFHDVTDVIGGDLGKAMLIIIPGLFLHVWIKSK